MHCRLKAHNSQLKNQINIIQRTYLTREESDIDVYLLLSKGDMKLELYITVGCGPLSEADNCIHIAADTYT